jgi:hypothetical protein
MSYPEHFFSQEMACPLPTSMRSVIVTFLFHILSVKKSVPLPSTTTHTPFLRTVFCVNDIEQQKLLPRSDYPCHGHMTEVTSSDWGLDKSMDHAPVLQNY